jgi:hypothetical protein
MEKKDVSEKDAKRLKEAVGQLSKLVSNSICADCHQQRSLWASVNFGVFLCSRCAGMHRHLGVHITQVRSINLDTWTPLQLLCVTINGNMWTNSWLLSNRSPDYGRHIVDDPSMSRFIQEKYENMKYGDNSGILLVTKSNFPYITVEKALEVYNLAMTLHRQQVDHCLIRPKLIAAAGFDYAVPKSNPGNRKLLLVMEDSRGGDQKHITQAHISGIPQSKKAAVTPVIPSFKTTSHQLGHTASASNIRVSNFIDIDDFGVDNSTIGIARVNISGDSMEKPTHPPSKSSSFGVFPTEGGGHNEPDWPSVNASSGENLNSFFKEPRALQPNLSASEQGFFGSFKSAPDQNIFNDTKDSTQNKFTPNFDLIVNEKNSDNGKSKSNNDSSNGSFFIENIFGPTSPSPAASNNGLGDFAIPPMAATPFSYNTVSPTNGNPAKKDGGDATQDKDFILSLYSK